MPAPLKQFNFKIADLDEQKVLELKRKARKFGQGRALTGGGELTSVKIEQIERKYGDFAQDYIDGYKSSFDGATQSSKKEYFNKLSNMRRIKRKSKLRHLAVIEAAAGQILPVSSLLEPSNISFFPDFIELQDELSEYPSSSTDKYEIVSTYDKKNPRINKRMSSEERIKILQKRIDECLRELKSNTNTVNIHTYKIKINKILKSLSENGFDISALEKECEMVITERKIRNYKNKLQKSALTPSAHSLLSTNIWKNEVYLLNLQKNVNGDTILKTEDKDQSRPAFVAEQKSPSLIDDLHEQLKCDEEFECSEMIAEPNKPLLNQYNLVKASAESSLGVKSPVIEYLNLNAFISRDRFTN